MAVINVDDIYILDETGAQVDKVTGLYFKNENASDTEKAQARANIGAGGSNDNLLDNAYFVGGGSQLGDNIFPINQRGQTSYSANGYGIDRWICYGGAITLAADGISVPANGVFTQPTNNLTQLNGKTLTLSVLYDSGIETGTAVLDLSGSTIFINGNGGQAYITSGGLVQFYKGSAYKVKAVKLELGTVSTIANDVPPNWWQELEKCQHYLWVVSFPSGSILSTGYASGDFFITDIILPTTIRESNLALTFNANVLIIGNGTAVVAASVNGVTRHGNHLRTYINPASALTNQNLYAFVTSADTVMVVSAEL